MVLVANLEYTTTTTTYRNDPGRFFGDGVQFKAKLIGILEVGEARGDRMCQEALQDLKMAIRAAGEHKQRITIHVTIDGLRLRDEKTGDSLYHHPVHKISFIAQDMTDSRAFGYIFGSPDSGHRFFGIKTDKAASQVVLAMRDLFQVVFELKKKEIELARQQIQSKSIHEHQLASLSSLKSAAGGIGAGLSSHNDLSSTGGGCGGSTLSMLSGIGGQSRATTSNRLGVNMDSKGAAKEMSPESVADLVDLEQELSSLQRGITQMERITPNEPAQPSLCGVAGKATNDDDPFGDSFTNFPTYNLLPPPESGRSRHKPIKSTDSTLNQPATTSSVAQNVTLSSLLSPAAVLSSSAGTLHHDDDDNWLHELDQQNDVFDTSKAGSIGMGVSLAMAPLAPSESTSTPTQQLSENSTLVDVELAAAAAIQANAQLSSGSVATTMPTAMGTTSSSPIPILGDGPSQPTAGGAVKSDAFTDLDPLGTGRTRPYVDKKYFFQDLKNPPKKVLNDLSSGGNGIVDITATGVHYTAASAVVDEFLSKDGLFEDNLTNMDGQSEGAQQMQQLQQQQQQQQHTLPPPPPLLNITNTTHTSGIAGLQTALNTSKIMSNTTMSATTAATASTTTTTLLIGVLAPPCTASICTCTISSTKYTSTASNVVVSRLTNTNHHIASSNSLLTTSTYSTNSTPASTLRMHHYQPTLSSSATSSCHTTAIPTNLHLNHCTLDSTTTTIAAAAVGDVVMMPRDTDPFSPTRKMSDPFQEGNDVFAKLDPFEFEFNNAEVNQGSSPSASVEARRSADVFNGPLQVNLPPESRISPTPAQPLNTAAQWRADVARLERQMNEPVAAMGNGSVITAGGVSSTVRSRPTPSGQLSAMAQPSSVFKQQTADVISSISNKKMPHLFGQTRFSKRDSNSINMCRLQESDSLSENEAAPEPPPRPDSALHAEPPPLPPKKQFNDIIIRPRVTSGNAVPPSAPTASLSSRYEFVNTSAAKTLRAAGSEVPPIPLPSRRVGRSDGTYPGPGRPRKPGHTEDDYLAPISSVGNIGSSAPTDVPPLLPPPTQTSTRSRAQRQHSLSKPQDIYENKLEILQQQQQKQQQALAESACAPTAAASLIPDITLSQLMTLSLDDLAAKLSVPVSKLSTMTLVELTSYLSEFIEKSKPQRATAAAVRGAIGGDQALATHMSPLPARRLEMQTVGAEPMPSLAQAHVFKVNFDQQATFVAKFDDTFGEDLPARRADGQSQDAFADFEQFNEPPVAPPPILSEASRSAALVPSADRYAVFREIIDKELQEQQENADLIGEVITENEDGSGGLSLTAGATDSTIAVSAVDEMGAHFEANFDDDDFFTTSATVCGQVQPPKIDTKITEVVAQSKDRYAALRDIILVENLFDNKPPAALQASQEFPDFSDELNEDQDQDLKHIMDGRVSSSGPDRLGLVDSRGFPAEPSSSALTVEDDEEDDDGGGESSLDSNDKDADVTGDAQDKYEKLSTSTQQLDGEKSDKPDMIDSLPERSASQPSPNLLNAKQDNKFLTVAGSSGLSSSKDDLEIDELMQRAISNLSLDSRERTSPANSATNMPTVIVTSGNSTALPRPNVTLSTQAQFNDVSTSPIPLQKSPTPGAAVQKSPLVKSPQPSPVLSQLSAVSNLIDTATKQIGIGGNVQKETEVKHSKEFWATFDSPKPSIEKIDKRARGVTKPAVKTASLHLPPPPPSNTSQNDTAESPCSSDPRDDGWSKSGNVGRRWTKKDRHQTSSSSRDLSPWDDELSDFQKQKRIPGVGPIAPPPGMVDRHGYYMRHTRRMNSCDEDYDYDDEFNARRDHRKLKPGLSRSRDNFDLESPQWYHHAPHHTWSPQEIEQAGLRARAFERSAYERSTYGPPVYDKRGIALPPNASSSYDRRSAYDKRSKYYRDYARPNYDFDAYGDPSLDRYRDGGSFEKAKPGRRADYENIYDEGRSPMGGIISGGAGGVFKSRAGEYLYERERKSFDRESVESFESATRRRRSFGSGDVYGSIESHEEFRERYGPEKTRSLRKGIKLRATGDIDYEQDSENDFHQRARMSSGANIVGGVADTRSLQRPNQLASAGGGGSAMSMGSGPPRARKSSGSSPWDGEEPPLPGQKSWKRPSSAADSERRLAESRRAVALGQTPSGSDGEKDRRFRKKQRSRGKDIPYSSAGAPTTTGSRYSSTVSTVPHPRDNYDYITYDDDDVDDEEDYVDEEYDEPPTDEDKFERLNRRRHEMHQRMLETERRQHSMGKVPISSLKCSAPTSAAKKYPTRSGDYDFDDYEQTPTPRSNASASLASAGSSYLATTSGGGGVVGGGSTGSATKFSFDGGFESDFNQSSPPPAPAGTASSCNSTPAATTASACVTPATKSSFRFSNDFSEREKMHSFAQNSTSVSSSQQFDLDATQSPASQMMPPIITQKLRFDDNVKVSQFDDAAFEDDFSNAQFDFEKDDQWNADSLQSTSNATLLTTAAKKHNLRNSKLQQRQELIKKSESINIFAKKSEDPFEDDEFFKAPSEVKLANNNNNNNNTGQPAAKSGATDNSSGFQCDDDFNFAKFDENM
ncbi:PREDICTED: protein disabled [Rhagoletis zephyria]|uniref:protein disabled n=1 Tax=Rhagoletis zephyria TaxID=28612 RepID=UPI0008114A46|nr:PREDICTED: protein disabled [Rhagoletis zephyria]